MESVPLLAHRRKNQVSVNLNMAETRDSVAETQRQTRLSVHGKLDHLVSAWRKRDGFMQLHVSVEFAKYGNTLFRPVTVSSSKQAILKKISAI